MPPFIQLVSHGSRLALGRCPTETRTAAHAGTDVSAPTSRPRPPPSRQGLRGSERFTSRQRRTAHRAPRRKVPTPLGRVLRRGLAPTLPPLTEPLHRLQRTGTRGEGAGLGLLIVNAVIRFHGGSLRLTNPHGRIADIQLPTSTTALGTRHIQGRAP